MGALAHGIHDLYLCVRRMKIIISALHVSVFFCVLLIGCKDILSIALLNVYLFGPLHQRRCPGKGKTTLQDQHCLANL
jgi:hypothetical protein